MIGQSMRGMINPYCMVPTLPEMIESVVPYYPPAAENHINNMSSGIFNMFLGVGQVIGPLFGAIMSEKYGFQLTCDIVSVISLFYAIAFYTFAEGQEAFRKIKTAPPTMVIAPGKS